ncbi:ABC-F family ATP-binding cassette domain-containing protein [Paralimibaculum aggregatum]|uniref:ABC-F family ATP-binding cassette domain-containing protein n=1 Tax=Paralimibaculum aggregatum TaxID=3036245 RepID=A0ABQ6LG46_9RHOB|nr:ABC-F family ATP-binding cassette domain-containing protein [Limibaculum sp. NKW23]GMG82292.1 ABC-F family ATP-binding cassette domain-containing protein [Limibaculum sp. NKW23]
MLTIRDLTFAIAGRPLFEGASAQIPAGARVGIVGRNGTGKTTLFRLIRGELSPDGGEISLPPRARIGGVAQEVPAGPEPLIEIVLAADEERARLLAEAERATDPARIAEIHARLADIQAHSAEARASTILAGLGFPAPDQARAAAEFSGGWRMRVALAAVLFSAPDLLLLDEPTNYLDLEGAVWLESYLARYPHTMLVISHDRGLLNRAVNTTLHLENRRLTLYGGGYDTFDRVRREKLMLQAAAAKKQQAVRAHLQSFVDRFRYKASKAKQAQARVKMLEKMEPIAAVIESSVAPIHLPEPEELPPPLLAFERASVGYDGRAVLSRLDLRIDQDDRIALLGANGEGKSTLAKLISDRLAVMEGTRRASSKLRIGYFAQHQTEELDTAETPLEILRRARPQLEPQKLRAMLAAGGTGAEIVETRVGELSGGQKARLMLTMAALDAPHMLILDEPTNHLDIESREALVSALNGFSGAVILISHDAHLVEAVADRLWLVKGGRVAPYDGDMDDYRRLLLATERGGEGTQAPPHGSAKRAGRRSAAEIRKALAPLRAEVAACEARLEKIAEMLERMDAKLADPALYQGPADRIEALQIKRGEILEGQERAEALWMAAQEKLDAAEAEARAGA